MGNLKIAVIAGFETTSIMLCEQLTSLLGEYMTFYPFSVGGWTGDADIDLVLISSHILFTRHSPFHIKKQTDIVIIKRTLSKSGWEKLQSLPTENPYLIVNDDRDSVVETISLLYELGLRHITPVPYFPSLHENYQITAAITPGEPQLVPDYIEHTIDIGARVVDISTLVEILTRFNLLNSETKAILDAYAERIITLSQGLQITMQGLIDGKNLFEKTLNMVQDGVMTFDEKGVITFINSTAEEIFGANTRDLTGQNIEELFMKHRMDIHLLSKDVKDQLVTIGKQEIIMNKMRILGRGKSTERVLIFKFAKKVEELELKLRTQLRDNGHTAKFSFKDIVTYSDSMKKMIERAQKMAKNELNVLLLGENGTGKELFAHSIHKHSLRSQLPFIPVNCGALSESLLESELFGYEDGAFTGAKRGGKPGLFEQAHRGTIFLDEIGDISPNLQTRLLRVLQQKEVLKVGGTKVLPVDVRVITATNRNLAEMVREGKFREDLYYRLKVLQIDIPPLRDRKEDIPHLIRHFLERRGFEECLSDEVMGALMEYDWPGNIRELENTIDYITVMSDGAFKTEDLPFIPEKLQCKVPEGRGTPIISQKGEAAMPVPADYLEVDMEMLMLKIILEAKQNGAYTGRRNLIGMARHKGLIVTENEVRKCMDRLREKSLIEVRIGRSGCTLSAKGYRYLKASEEDK